MPFPYPVAPFIQSHHERWDGTGYPDGLKGEAIPLGARVLAVVDYYDALTAHRPYHRAMSQAEALDTLRQESGRALDPRLVDLFVEVLPLTGEIEEEEARERLLLDRSSPRTGAPATGFSTRSARSRPRPRSTRASRAPPRRSGRSTTSPRRSARA